MNTVYQLLTVLVMTASLELCWTLYIHNVRDENLIKAGLFSAGIFLAGAMSTVVFMENKWMMIPGAFGAFCGTYVSKFFYKKEK